MRYRLLFAVALAAASARASNVSDQVSINNAQATATNPRSGNLSEILCATFDITEKWSLNAGATLTAEGATPAASAGQFGTSGSVLTMFSAGLDWDATDNWSLGLDLDFSPRSTQLVGTDISVGTISGQALIQSRTSQFDGGLDVSYDTAGESNLEWYFNAGLSGTHLDTDQSITRAKIGSLTFAQLKAACAAQPTRKVCK